jgi:hypothetical protein
MVNEYDDLTLVTTPWLPSQERVEEGFPKSLFQDNAIAFSCSSFQSRAT